MQRSMAAGGPPLLALPEDILLMLLAILPMSAVASLAQVHSHLCGFIRKRKRVCGVAVVDNAGLKTSSRMLQRLPNLECLRLTQFRAMTTAEYLPLNLRYLTAPQVSSLQLRQLSITGLRTLSPLTTGFPALRELTLCSRQGQAFNLDGSLSSLSSVTSLRCLKVACLGSHAGLAQLTQLRSLSLTFPEHGDCDIDELVCTECGEVHEYAIEDFFEQLEGAMDSPTVMCSRDMPPLLDSLTLDFNGSVHTMGVNPALNIFHFRPGSSSSLQKLHLKVGTNTLVECTLREIHTYSLA